MEPYALKMKVYGALWALYDLWSPVEPYAYKMSPMEPYGHYTI